MACVRARGLFCIILADFHPHIAPVWSNRSPNARRSSPTTERESEIDDRFPNKKLFFKEPRCWALSAKLTGWVK